MSLFGWLFPKKVIQEDTRQQIIANVVSGMITEAMRPQRKPQGAKYELFYYRSISRKR